MLANMPSAKSISSVTISMEGAKTVITLAITEMPNRTAHHTDG